MKGEADVTPSYGVTEKLEPSYTASVLYSQQSFEIHFPPTQQYETEFWIIVIFVTLCPASYWNVGSAQRHKIKGSVFDRSWKTNLIMEQEIYTNNHRSSVNDRQVTCRTDRLHPNQGFPMIAFRFVRRLQRGQIRLVRTLSINTVHRYQ